MIFQQLDDVLSGRKTQTRRLWHDDYRVEGGICEKGVERIYRVPDSNAIAYRVGQFLPVVPKRAQPAVRDENGNIRRVCITALRCERLQAITEADAQAEGVASVEAYRALWERINDKTKGARWQDNPRVVVITFKRAWVVEPEAQS